MTHSGPGASLDTGFGLDNHPLEVAWGVITDVGGWLRSLGLDQYETVFRDNALGAKAGVGYCSEKTRCPGKTGARHASRTILRSSASSWSSRNPKRGEAS
jgi:hypothetical protein